ncbi:ATP-binding protein [Marinobacter caseinilyticus]|uniref:ATP-binding protein n=1 Tax=Marinobacter caseinilyticus TaxID=2692195 RepID=UPI00140C72B3|nr:ATP-binding protein [Marinobacter caseinilyticus]
MKASKPVADTSTMTEQPNDRVQTITFPWLGMVAGLGLVAFLLLQTDPLLRSYYPVPDQWLRPEFNTAALGLLILLICMDLRRYHRQFVRQQADVQRLRRRVNEIWDSKKHLQRKAHTYSDHADKLKRFISDKLLDYIEYDEKFLHFKSIAAEVRHNGVISFDKVQTALQQAQQSARSEGSTLEPGKIDAALEAMRYLWDLLDLSTADNLALHIGNLLCECEEHYYQQVLNSDATGSQPYQAVYAPQTAALRALVQVSPDALPVSENAGDYTHIDAQWCVRLAPVGELLGNENHLILMLENLLKNAQFFSRKRGFSSPFAPVALTLTEYQGQACFRIYNRGPHLRDEDRQNLFQLGFSTRRVREHHGRGLGLYFVNEIVKGYEGQISVHNIDTPETQYAVRIQLENDEVMTERVDIVLQDGKPQCRLPGGEWDKALEWAFKSPVRSVEVTTTGDNVSERTQRIDGFDNKGKQHRFDPGQPERPRWRLTYQPKRGGHKLGFEPLDINGVEFEIRLPTAQYRLDSSEMAMDGEFDAEVERLDAHFRAQSPDDSRY